MSPRSPCRARSACLWTYEAAPRSIRRRRSSTASCTSEPRPASCIAVGLANGKLRWRYKAGEARIGESSPAVAGGGVFIGDLIGVVHAVNVADGKPAGPSRPSRRSSHRRSSSATRVLIGSYDGKLYAPRRRDRQAAVDVLAPRTTCTARRRVWNGVAHFAGCDEFFHAVASSDGQGVLKLSRDRYTGASVAIVDGVAYFGTFDNQVLALDIAARKVLWRYEHPDRKFPFYSSAAVSNGPMVLGGRDKNVHALDMATGKQRWTYMTRARIDSSPAIAGNRVFVGSSDGRLYVLDLASGKKIWEFESGGGFTTSPAVAQGRVVIGDVDGRVYAFGK